MTPSSPPRSPLRRRFAPLVAVPLMALLALAAAVAPDPTVAQRADASVVT